MHALTAQKDRGVRMLSAEDDKFLHSRQPLLEKWFLEDIIGEGSSGTVYRIRNEEGSRYALKVIPVSLANGADSLGFANADFYQRKSCLDEITGDILSEIRVMQTLKNSGRIVAYHEFDILEKEDASVRFILIRMDLLQPLNRALRMRETEFTDREVIAMGIDLLAALAECRNHNIIHRDIKPSNIFVTEDNRYLLGDFGSARLLEKTMMASRKGTLAYMAPEIASGKSFNSTADIYSLGIVLYQLVNNRRLPLLSHSFQFADMELAVERRLSGILLPYPENADKELGIIICKMCAYLPGERYQSPEECIRAFNDYLTYGRGSKGKLTGRKLSGICAVFITLFLLLFVGNVFSKGSKTTVAVGISSGNLNSSGAVACDGNWLYFSQDIPGERGIRISQRGMQKEVLCDYIMHDINITEDYVVFSSRYTTAVTQEQPDVPDRITGLYRMNKDGSGLVCLDDSMVYNPVAYNGYIYYFKSRGEFNLLCRILVEGEQTEVLGKFDKYTFSLYPFGNSLYIYDFQSARLIALKLRDGSQTVILDQPLIHFCIEDGFLYYSLPDTVGFGNKVYFHPLNPSIPTPLTPEQDKAVVFPYGIYEFHVSGGVIYASSNLTASQKGKPREDGIWRINQDGSELEKIYTGNAAQLQITDQKLYFADKARVYCMNLDGSNIHEFEDITLFYTYN